VTNYYQGNTPEGIIKASALRKPTFRTNFGPSSKYQTARSLYFPEKPLLCPPLLISSKDPTSRSAISGSSPVLSTPLGIAEVVDPCHSQNTAPPPHPRGYCQSHGAQRSWFCRAAALPVSGVFLGHRRRPAPGRRCDGRPPQRRRPGQDARRDRRVRPRPNSSTRSLPSASSPAITARTASMSILPRSASAARTTPTSTPAT
jgi:hypothetical protein